MVGAEAHLEWGPGSAPELAVSQWLNTDAPLSLAGLAGQVVMLHTFQMLCPGCVMQATPQAVRLWRQFHAAGLQVIGLHTVFEHHAVMTPAALTVYLSEFRIPFPVAVDQPQADHPVPLTMATYGLRGTPSTLLIDRGGRLRYHHFGMESDETLAATIAELLDEAR